MAVLDAYHLRRSFSRKRIGTRCTLTIEYTFIRCNVYVRSKNDHRHRQSHTQNEQIKKKQSIDCFLFMLLIILRAEPWTACSEP